MKDVSDIGISQQRLDEIELRLIGVDSRPWGYSPEWKIVAKGSKKANQKALTAAARNPDGSPYVGPKFKDGPTRGEKVEEAVYSQREMLESLTLFKQHANATNDMAIFVAHAPDDVEDLVSAVKYLRSQLAKAREEREAFKKEMLSLRVEAAALQERLTGIVASWKNLKQIMG